MNLKSFVSALNGLWLMEESQAIHWADIAFKVMLEKSMTAVPVKDKRWAYGDFYRVDANGLQTGDGPVQVIQIKGPMMQDDYCGSPGMSSMEQAIGAANADNSIKSLLLWMDTGGGTVSGTENLANAIKAFKKPSVTFINTMMCSAGYWVGSASDEIVADGANKGYNSIIGNIGTKAMLVDRSKEQEMKGIKVTSVYATKSKRKGAYSDEITSGNYTRLQKELDSINETFIDAVKSSRGERLVASKEDVFEGDVYNARQALHLGLIDKIADFKYAVKRSLQMANTLKA